MKRYLFMAAILAVLGLTALHTTEAGLLGTMAYLQGNHQAHELADLEKRVHLLEEKVMILEYHK